MNRQRDEKFMPEVRSGWANPPLRIIVLARSSRKQSLFKALFLFAEWLNIGKVIETKFYVYATLRG
jgi:hypothetical protein